MIEIVRKASVDDIKHAIELRKSECFGAMNIANALHNRIESDEWYLARRYTLEELEKALKEGK